MSGTTPANDIDSLVVGVRAGDRGALGRAITLIESQAEDKRVLGEDLLERLLDPPHDALRIGITGVPGVGKSTFIDRFGSMLTQQGHRVAVLAVDPTSPISGGSILGDKTRMARLAQDSAAFIRPSPSSGTLGGVAARTRETMLLCEAAGYDVILVETVGVGQSETMVEGMVDFFLVLMLAGAGDELQGIKRGILEIADMIAVNKTDGDNISRAQAARVEYHGALQLLRPKSASWPVKAICISALEGLGLEELWAAIGDHRERLDASGERAARRSTQLGQWMKSEVHAQLHAALEDDPALQALIEELEVKIRAGKELPSRAARKIIELFRGDC